MEIKRSTRRIVTGHDATGKAVALFDGAVNAQQKSPGGNAITMLHAPVAGPPADVLIAYYRSSGTTIGIADAETPSGTINGSNTAFTLAHNALATTLVLFLNDQALTPGGVDFKLGLSPGLMGYEGLDPSTRPFYTLSYVTNYLLAFQTVGAIATVHVSPQLDVIAGIDLSRLAGDAGHA